MKLVGFTTFFNESSRGHMRGCFENLLRYCDDVVALDDGSTDDSFKVAREYTDHVLHCPVNDFSKETSRRGALLQYALGLSPDWIFWLDQDERLDRCGTDGGLRELCERGHNFSYDFEEVTLWRSLTWRRLDYLGRGRFLRLWPCRLNELRIPVADGLHRQLYPAGLPLGFEAPFRVLHYGYSTQEKIERRWRERTRLGVPVGLRRKCLDEREMVLELVPLSWFPPGVDVFGSEPRPEPIRYNDQIMREAGL